MAFLALALWCSVYHFTLGSHIISVPSDSMKGVRARKHNNICQFWRCLSVRSGSEKKMESPDGKAH